ncbi:M1 family metallopeptidase [Melioribacter sp. OK-6-Me]|uniref:M1 family metallopeptidase n=1 Tax=unclassified Melioribacter TaxID=2627329 RepID=UPI003ED90990
MKKFLIPLIILALLALTLLIGAFVFFPEVRSYKSFSFSDDDLEAAPVSDIDVLHYNIKISLHPKDKYIIGEAGVLFLLKSKENKELKFDFYENMHINLVKLNGKKVEFERNNNEIIIELNSTLPDTSKLEVYYKGTPLQKGFGSFNFEHLENSYFVYTMNEPTFASTWFTCNDRPNDKALVDIYIENDSNYVSLSNGKLIEVNKNADKKIYHWKTYYPISTYLIAIYSGDYQSYFTNYISTGGDTLSLQYYSLKNNFEKALKDFEDHPDYLKIFEKLFGVYPFTKEKYAVAEFLWKYGAMEHQTLTGIGSNFITGRKFFQDMLIHELAHHWWGNAVSPSTWRDIWLNEGFATYSEALYWEAKAGKSALISTMNSKISNFNDTPLYNPGFRLFSRTIYDKGAWVLHMLRNEIGDSLFFASLRNYLNKYKYKNASTRDFQNICENTTGMNLDYFFKQWVYEGRGIIEAEIRWESHKFEDKYRNKIFIEQLQSGYKNYIFPLQLKLVGKKESDIKLEKLYIDNRFKYFELVTNFEPVEIILDPESKLLAKFTVEKKND